MNVLSPWFPPEVKPVREGVYLTRLVSSRPWTEGMLAKWNGKKWLDAVGEDMFLSGQHVEWRGLAFDPAQSVPHWSLSDESADVFMVVVPR